MHVPHISHSGQLGFINQPSAVPLSVPLPEADHDSQTQVALFHENVNSSMEERAVPLETSPIAIKETASKCAIVLPSRTEEDHLPKGECNNPVSNPQQQVTAVSNCSSSSPPRTDLNSVEKKILRLFLEGFQQSSKSNISPQVKVLGALNHACYKEHLGIIVTHFNLSSVAIPCIKSLGKTAGREKYLNEVVKAYDETYKDKIGV